MEDQIELAEDTMYAGTFEHVPALPPSGRSPPGPLWLQQRI